MPIGKSDFDGLVTRLDAATSAIAKTLDAARTKLAAALADAGVPAAQEQEAFDALDVAIKTLEGMGTDPTDPIPDVVPPTGGTV